MDGCVGARTIGVLWGGAGFFSSCSGVISYCGVGIPGLKPNFVYMILTVPGSACKNLVSHPIIQVFCNFFHTCVFSSNDL